MRTRRARRLAQEHQWEHTSHRIGDIPLPQKATTLRKARLHMDATRSAALFAQRMILVEGVSDAVVLRQLGESGRPVTLPRRGSSTP